MTSRLERGLAQLEEAHVGTIHGFCADLLKQRPLQAGVDPLFEVATEEEKDRLYRRVFDRWLQEKLSDPPPGVRRHPEARRRRGTRVRSTICTRRAAIFSTCGIFPLDGKSGPSTGRTRSTRSSRERFRSRTKAAESRNDRDYLYQNLVGVHRPSPRT